MDIEEEIAELESQLKGKTSYTLPEVFKVVADKLLGDRIEEKTELGLEEIKTITLLTGLAEYWENENEPEFASFLREITQTYLLLKISHKRRSRAELVKAMTKIASRLKEAEEEEREKLKL